MPDCVSRRAIVTGHSRGLGAAIAQALLQASIPVLGLARRPNPELAARFPGTFSQVEVDLADPVSLERWLNDGALAAYLSGSGSALLVNNAGIVQPIGPPGTQPLADIARAVSLNVSAVLMLSSAFVQAAGSAVERRILHISSGAGRNATPGWSVYCATKAAVDHHARAVALDRVAGLRICSMAPGVIDTDMQAEIRSTPVARFPNLERFERMKREGALVTPGQCAQRLVAYLLEDRFGDLPVADLRDLSVSV
jgi:NAD(P)-dependent dehydrogenase (short-subunit alcohol dehydrogenase family)